MLSITCMHGHQACAGSQLKSFSSQLASQQSKMSVCMQTLTLEGQLKALHKAHEGSKLNLTQAIEACNFATKKRRAAERQLAKLQVC